LLFWNDQVFYEYPEHLSMAHKLVDILSETQIPFDLVAEEGIDQIYKYDVVIAPMLRYLHDEQVEELLRYAKQGGTLVVVDPFGTEDKYARPRQTDPLEEICPVAKDFRSVTCGKGQILRLGTKDIPERQSALWNLMEERGNSAFLSHAYMNEARKRELEKGVDFGPVFVKRLEKALKMRLRWCPEETDPGVYLHAFRIPAKPGRPDRLVVHLVNYRLPIVLQLKEGQHAETASTLSGDPVVMRDLRITVPLPKGMKVKQVDALSACDEPGSVKWSVEGTDAILSVDELTIYKALVIELENSAG
ncbi:MAG: beta-galactosidase trimerization domain-containing protein, partial [bacterium]